MNNGEELIKGADIQKIADEGAKIYEQIKSDYDPKERGRFLAIEIESKKVYLGNTSADALESAGQSHPNKVFYAVKVGFGVAETMALDRSCCNLAFFLVGAILFAGLIS